MEVHKYLCACGRMVERARNNLPSVRCFDCRAAANRERSNAYKITGSANKLPAIREAAQKRRAERQALIQLTNAQRSEREFHIVEQRLEGKTLEEIAQGMTPQITRERVRQILEKVSKREGITFPSVYRARGTSLVDVLCHFCGEVKKVPPSNVKEGRKYFHRGCYKSKWVHSDGTPMDKLEIAKVRYHTDPERKRKHKILMLRRYREVMADPKLKAQRREREKVYAKRWHDKKKQDPEWLAKQSEKSRAKYAWIKANDPVKYEKMKERDRARGQRYEERKRLSPPGALPPGAT